MVCVFSLHIGPNWYTSVCVDSLPVDLLRLMHTCDVCFQWVVAVPDHQADKACGAADSLNARHRPDGHNSTGSADHRPLGVSQQRSGVFSQDLHHLCWIWKPQVSRFQREQGERATSFSPLSCSVVLLGHGILQTFRPDMKSKIISLTLEKNGDDWE